MRTVHFGVTFSKSLIRNSSSGFRALMRRSSCCGNDVGVRQFPPAVSFCLRVSRSLFRSTTALLVLGLLHTASRPPFVTWIADRSNTAVARARDFSFPRIPYSIPSAFAHSTSTPTNFPGTTCFRRRRVLARSLAHTLQAHTHPRRPELPPPTLPRIHHVQVHTHNPMNIFIPLVAYRRLQ